LKPATPRLLPKREPIAKPIMSRKLLYRRVGSAVISILALLATATLSLAQMPQLKRPQEENEEKKPAKPKPKKVKGPRAIGLLQMNQSGKGSLIPIAIQVDGKFYDASVYKADPVPMALEPGTVYEVEQTGTSQGLFTVNGALHGTARETLSKWTGTGSYYANGTEAAKTTRKAENVPVGMAVGDGDSDAPPKLTRGNSKSGSSGASTSPESKSPSTSGSTDKPADSGKDDSGKDKDKQEATKASETPAAATPSSASGEKSSDPKTPETKPSEQKTSDQKASDQKSSDAKPADQKAENYYRPTLRRGKPTQSAPPDEVDPKTGKPESQSPITGPIKFIPAISDDGGPEPKSYKFYWKTGEEDERRTQMLALAADELRAYTTALAKNSIPAKPVPAKSAAAKTLATKSAAQRKTAKPVPPDFQNVQFNAFDVWANNQPVMILTAEARPAIASGATTAPETYSITLVARADIYGTLRKVYAGVTDKFHLDVTPKMELIDAVDADGDGRGELLFRQTTDNGSGYVIYRPTADKLWKMFESAGS
jgi:hypothetical protein